MNRSARWSPWGRFTILAVGLLSVGVLVRLAVQAHERRMVATHAVLEGVAERIASRLASDLTRDLYLSGTALLSRAGLGRMAPPGTTTEDPTAILRAFPAVEACQCAALLPPRYAFYADLTHNRMNVVTDSGEAVPPDLEWLRQHLAVLKDSGSWSFTILTRLDNSGRFVFVTRSPSDTAAVLGYAVDSGAVNGEVFQSLIYHREAMLTEMGLSALANEAVDIEVRLADNTPILPGTATDTSAAQAIATIGALFGGITIRVALAASAETALLGTPIGASPVPLLMLLAVATALAMLIAYSSWRRAAQLAETRADLVANMSHELRTPLAEILLVAESLQRGHYAEPAERHQAIDVVLRESRRLLGMIGNVLQMAASRSEAPLNTRMQTLGDEIRRIVSDYRSLAATQAITLEVSIASDPAVIADKEAVRQMVLNLLDNACRHGPAGGVVQVVMTATDAWLQIAVHDQGKGIPPAIASRAWEPYVTHPLPDRDTSGGSGIGLAVVRRLALRQRGQVGSDLQHGAHRVFFTLPRGDA